MPFCEKHRVLYVGETCHKCEAESVIRKEMDEIIKKKSEELNAIIKSKDEEIQKLLMFLGKGEYFPHLIWLDDALLEQYTVLFPLLKKYNLNSGIIIAVITDVVGKHHQWTDPYLQVPCMNVDQLKEMMNFGCKIASHTVTHPSFKSLTAEKLRWELDESKKWIQHNLGVTPELLVVPYNEIYQEQLNIAREYYRFVRPAGVTSNLIIHKLADDPEHKFSAKWPIYTGSLYIDKILEPLLKSEKFARDYFNTPKT